MCVAKREISRLVVGVKAVPAFGTELVGIVPDREIAVA
jgi:hypothetical protein